MFSKNHPIILFVDRNGFSIFQETLANILRLNFPPEAVANLDVINKDGLITLIDSFIEKNKVLSSNLIVILSDEIIYEKDIERQGLAGHESEMESIKRQDIEIQNFLENVPFEEVLAKAIKVENTTRLVAVNKDLVSSIVDPFRKKGSIVLAIVPSFLYGKSVSFAGGLNKLNALEVLRKSEIAKTGNLQTDHKQVNASQDLGQKEGQIEKPQKTRQYILIGVFLILLIVLGIVLAFSLTSNTNSGKTTIPGPSAVKNLTPVILNIESIKVTIVNTARPEITNDLKSGLSGIGFKDITETSASTAQEKSSIWFSKNIPADIRQKTVLEIKKILQDLITLEDQDSDSNIKILIGKAKMPLDI